MTYSPTAGGRVSSMGFVNPLRSVEFRQLDREARMVRAHALISDLSLPLRPTAVAPEALLWQTIIPHDCVCCVRLDS